MGRVEVQFNNLLPLYMKVYEQVNGKPFESFIFYQGGFVRFATCERFKHFPYHSVRFKQFESYYIILQLKAEKI